MSKLRIITLYKLCPVQAQAVQENAKRPRAGCNIQLIKMVQDIFSPYHLSHKNHDTHQKIYCYERFGPDSLLRNINNNQHLYGIN